MAMSTAALAAVVVGVRVNRPSDIRPWIVIGAAQLAFLVADAVWYLSDGPDGVPFPSIADAFYLLGYPLLAAGMLMFIRCRQPRYRRTAAIDAVLVGLAATLVLWVTVIDGLIHDETLPFVERLVAVAYPIGDVIILAATAYLLLTGGHGRRSLYLFVGSLCALLLGDVVEAQFGAGSAALTSADLLWLLSYTLFGLATLDPSMRELTEPAEHPIRPESGARLLLIAGSIAVLPLFALYQRFFAAQIDFPVIGVAGLIVIVAILLRMHEMGAVLGRSERRYASLLANASDAFAIVKTDGRFVYVSAASEHVLGYRIAETVNRSALDLVHPRARTRAVAVLNRVATTPGGQEEVEVPVKRSDGQWRWLSVTATNRLNEPTVDGIVLNYRDVTERKQLEQRLERQAFTDALTGLANRPLFVDRLVHVLARRRASGGATPVSVLFLDVDDFKTVNDSLGHSAGDELLVTLATRLRSTLRRGDTCARLGGDEFAVLLSDAAQHEAEDVAARLLDSLAQPVKIAAVDVTVSVSI